METRPKAAEVPGAEPSYPAIGDYAVIGDCRSAALISRAGSIDWLCWPRFDSPSLFGALLDARQGGHFSVQPATVHTATRRYLPDTNVLETTFRTATGLCRLIDLMPVTSEAIKRRDLWPEHELLRVVECLEGEVEIEVTCAPRPDYGARVPRLRDRGALGFYYEHKAMALILRSDIPLTLSEHFSDVHGRVRLRAGERRHVALVQSEGEPAVLDPLGPESERKLALSVRWWEQWSARCQYEGQYRESVVRSALALKLCCFAPSGAIVAAPTTSLPEVIGGVRNWDYRYCWLRDASLTVQALFDLGLTDEARAFLSWLLHATRMTRPELHIVYDVYGEARLPERELSHLEGYRRSRPVRVGNDAYRQLQLDIYGEVVNAAYAYTERGGQLDRTTARVLVELGETVCRRWREPDEGIWEIRSERQHHTLSKVMCWVALDRLLKLHPAHLTVPALRFARERDLIRDQIERLGYNEALESYVSTFGGHQVDASLLLLSHHGYVDPKAARMRSTLARIIQRLGRGSRLYRYLGPDDGLPPGEGTFGICAFWAVTCQALAGDLEGATRRFEELLADANDVGLYAEEIDPVSGGALGNFPQAFTHVGLIDAALTLEESRIRRPRPRQSREHAAARVTV